ncbi:MAG: DUF1302 domain-containing protein [Parvibaculum sp.]|uniref:DUF1302 domain-containing protein n=1 Tax=Parvibaculum sp. TaxID=2024848 RepID=UPI0028471F96|nr:DUF1302 domain-containing protein [Parvibaculum sp.]MDR3498573.1 DUF1302 domain-containing protein [Parvibaculum sp.]
MRLSAGTSPVTAERRSSLIVASAMAGALAIGFWAGAAQADAYKFGDIDLSIDTTVSAGLTMRTSARDCSHVSLVNGGCRSSSGRTTGVNSDNGNLNFNRWDLADATGRITADVQAKWENYGVFVRPTAFYNAIYANNDLRFHDLNDDGKGQLDYSVNVLDAFVYGNYDIAGHSTTIRFGKQALNWGESLFITGGINSFQAFDVTALRSAASELKDGMTPMPMVYASFAATEALTVEAFWQFSYKRTELDPAGSFFAVNDIVGKGSLYALSSPAVDNPDLAIAPGDLAALLGGAQVPIALRRSEDRGHSNTNQFGVAAHYYADNVGTGTDFGAYFVRYSSRLPYLGFTNGGLDTAQSCATIAAATLGALTCATAQGVKAAFAYGANQAKYFYDFPTINTLGASFSTTVEGTALSGEMTFTPQMPFGISDSELNASQIDGLGAAIYLSGGATNRFSSYLNGVGANQSTLSHIDLNAWQGQFGTITSFTTSDFIPRNLDADGATFVVNAGFVYVPSAGDYPLNRSGFIGGIKNPFAAALLTDGATNPQYATSFSSGYRMLLKADYNNAFSTPVTLSPYVAWRNDVLGYSPGPNTANYLKGLKEVTLGVDADYQSRIKASLSWTSSFGAGWYNSFSDRDFAQASISYSF